MLAEDVVPRDLLDGICEFAGRHTILYLRSDHLLALRSAHLLVLP